MVALATLVVTASGIMIGILAIFGYGTFKDEVKNRSTEAASAAATAAADAYFKGQSFRDTIKENLNAATWQSGTATLGQALEKIADEYPKEGGTP
jgi:hypothetical protein